MTDAVTVTPDAKPSFADRLASQAAEVRLVRALLSLLAFPFYLLGLLVGVLILAVRWCYAAVLIGVADAAKRGNDAG